MLMLNVLGKCICAPNVTGPDGNSGPNACTLCVEKTFGYDPITGCQDCTCNIEGTISANESCALDSGNCQ